VADRGLRSVANLARNSPGTAGGKEFPCSLKRGLRPRPDRQPIWEPDSGDLRACIPTVLLFAFGDNNMSTVVIIVVTLIAIVTARGSSSPLAETMRSSCSPMIAEVSPLPPSIRPLARRCHRSWSPLPHDHLARTPTPSSRPTNPSPTTRRSRAGSSHFLEVGAVASFGRRRVRMGRRGNTALDRTALDPVCLEPAGGCRAHQHVHRAVVVGPRSPASASRRSSWTKGSDSRSPGRS
jgi:hypothetical protein